MGTLNNVWNRLKALLDAAMKGKTAPGAKADPKKVAAAIHQFLTGFAAIMAEFEDIYKAKAKVDERLVAASDKAMKLLQPLLQQVDAAHKDGFNADNSLQENLDGRIGEMMDRMKDLRRDRSSVQWG
jgi:hypothetical protein